MTSLASQRYARLSIAAALTTIVLKLAAYRLTGSIGLLSDAAESGVNLVAAIAMLWALQFSARPPDKEHTFGHSKAEYFASGLEGALILIAAASIAIAAWPRLLQPQPLEQVNLALILSVAASAINGAAALVLLQAGKRLRSIALQADAYHLLTDVWTSVGVLAGLLLVRLTGWYILDPIIALAVAVNIIWSGFRLLQETGAGLLDSAIPVKEQKIVDRILSRYEPQGIQFHALRTRVAGSRRFISFHMLVPGSWTVQQGHDLCETIELEIIKALPGSCLFTHLEPIEDPASWNDADLDRAPLTSPSQP